MISLLEYMDDEPSKESTWATAHHLMLDLQKQDALIMREALARATLHKREPDDPLAAMTHHTDAPGLTARMPELGTSIPKLSAPAPEMVEWLDTVADSTALPYDATMMRVAPMGHKFGGWGA